MNLNYTYVFIGSFILGVASFSLYTESYILLLILLPMLLARKYRFYAFVVIIAFALGGLRVHVVEDSSEALNKYLGEVSVVGVIVSEPGVRERTQQLVIHTKTINGDNVSQKLISNVEKFPTYKYGDEILFQGVLERPENFENETGRSFDYINYLAKDDIHYRLSFPEVEYISGGHGNFIKSGLFEVKQAWLFKIQELIPDPHAALLGGLVVGAKESLGKNLEEDFRKVGLIHIVVLSGYNVTIIAEAFMRLLSFLPRVFSLSLGALSIVFFAILTGGSATIVRASVMALIVLFARATNREADVTRALFIAAFFMVLENPMIVLYDPSFQLSFMATVGLIYVSPIIEKYFNFVPTKFQLKEFAVSTTSTQVFLPILVYMMGNVSLVSLPVNILVLTLIPATMLFGFLSGLVGFLNTTLAFPFVAITYGLLSYELQIVEFFSKLPFSTINIPSVSPIILLALYALFIGVYFRYSKGIKINIGNYAGISSRK